MCLKLLRAYVASSSHGLYCYKPPHNLLWNSVVFYGCAYLPFPSRCSLSVLYLPSLPKPAGLQCLFIISKLHLRKLHKESYGAHLHSDRITVYTV